MTIAASAAPSLDPETLLANAAILVAALGAAVAGVYRGWQKIKETLSNSPQGPHKDERVRVLSATLTETTTLTMLTESNRDLKESVCELRETVAEVTRQLRDQNDEARELRYTMRRTSEALDRVVSSLDHNSRVVDRANK